MSPLTKLIEDHPSPTTVADITIQPPDSSHGGEIWRVARDAGTLDLNSSYAYLMFCRDFSATSRIALLDGEVVGFALGYMRPDSEDRLFLWQIAVDEKVRGRRLAARLLDSLIADSDVRELETTITDDNVASQRLFQSFADRHGATVSKRPQFEEDDFPDNHDAELLYVIGDLRTTDETTTDTGAPMTTPPNAATELESNVRSYSRSWPTVFQKAVGSTMIDEDGREYLDFFAGAGALNYGHNNRRLKEVLIDHLTDDRVVHGLDMLTDVRREFLETFRSTILEPRGLDYRVAFPGPGGANAVEAALKLARKATGRESVINFTNAFHGMTLGALSVTGNSLKRGGAGVPLVHATPMPYDDYFDGDVPDFLYFERMLKDLGSGLNEPAAVIVETVQGEGGMNAARTEWLRGLADLCREHGILLILDDIQMGCGRTGGFFSFEEAGIVPDIVCLSKSISGYGLPMALTLIRPELDIWEPGEHNGTFRGIGPAFATATESIRAYWSDDELERSTLAKGALIESRFNQLAAKYQEHGLIAKGRGLARGLQFEESEAAGAVCRAAFERGLLMETSGPSSEVMKLLPALTITEEELLRGLDIIDDSVAAVLAA